jgi:SAM-dependent methyltransferase
VNSAGYGYLPGGVGRAMPEIAPRPCGAVPMEIPTTTTQEMMDDPGCSVEALRGELRNIALINRLLGTHAIVRRYLECVVPLWRRRAGAAPDALSVLDVGTGAADVPLAVVEWARRRRVPVRVVGVDRHPTVVRIAARSTPPRHVSVVQADASALPFPDASFDVCLCNLVLHHLDWDERVALLRRLHAVSRLGFLVVDLLRSPGGYAAVWLLTRLFRNPLTRHDGPLSVRRAMSWPEYLRCARDADVRGLRLARGPLFRVALSRTG